MGKKICIKNITAEENGKMDKLVQTITYIKRMKIYPPFNLEPRTDLSRTLGKNSLVGDGLVSPTQKTTSLIIETNSKVQESKTYDEIITTQFIRTTKEKLLMRSFETQISIKHRLTKSYQLIEQLLDANKLLELSTIWIILLSNTKYGQQFKVFHKSIKQIIQRLLYP